MIALAVDVLRKPLLKHNLEGNCYQELRCDCCFKCHTHNQPRGSCIHCPPCEACEVER